MLSELSRIKIPVIAGYHRRLAHCRLLWINSEQ